MLTIGVVKTSYKENERRVPIYPEHLSWIPEVVRRHLIFETGYGSDYGYSDNYFSGMSAGILPREDLFIRCDILLLPKPVATDLMTMRAGQILCGWTHCVQQRDIAQAAIERRLTLISWEGMHSWGPSGVKLMHIFYKNNELAGYSSILHVLQLLGMDGLYGARRLVVVLGYGSVSRGAIYALHGRGFNNIRVYTRRPTHLVMNQNPDVYYMHFYVHDKGELMTRRPDGSEAPLIDELAEADVICNGVLQDVENPLMFVDDSNMERLKPRAAIVDISCDKGMGFSFARPTTFDEPLISLERGITYYSVDHAPTYLWSAASREISRAIIPFLGTLSEGPASWENCSTILNAIDIRDGVVRNRLICSFQKRQATELLVTR